MVNLRAEAQEPFRFFKLYLFGGLAAGAGLGLFIIGTRLVKAVPGGRGRARFDRDGDEFRNQYRRAPRVLGVIAR